MIDEDMFPCVGICLPDVDEAYCIGCGRPWGAPRSEPDAVLPAPSLPDEPPRETA